jgi:hypothetical protein
MKKLLAVIFFPQILIWPRKKYPDFYTLRDGTWEFNHRAARKAWWKKWQELIFSGSMVTVVLAVVAGLPIYYGLGTEVSKICVYQYHHYPQGKREIYHEAVLNFMNGTDKTYFQRVGNANWVSDDLERPTVKEHNAISAFLARYHVGMCVEP